MRPLSGILGGGVKVFPHDLLNGGGLGPMVKKDGNYWFVDGDAAGEGGGRSWQDPKSTISQAVAAASAFDVIYIQPKKITDFTGDPTSYAETIIIPATKPHLSLIGVSRGRTQGGLPQIKIGAGATAMITVRAAGCLIQSLGINGISSTGGGILLDDDYSTKTAFGTTIDNCHIKNCVGSTATNGLTGGGIMWSAEGNAWQCSITNNLFYKNVADVTLMGTSSTRPQDILIQGNEFKSAVSSAADANIIGNGGGFQTVTIDNNVFGDIPALGSGTHATYIDLTGTLGGMLTRNMFGIIASEAASNVTFGAAATVLIPTTVYMAGNMGEPEDTGASNDFGPIFRT